MKTQQKLAVLGTALAMAMVGTAFAADDGTSISLDARRHVRGSSHRGASCLCDDGLTGTLSMERCAGRQIWIVRVAHQRLDGRDAEKADIARSISHVPPAMAGYAAAPQ